MSMILKNYTSSDIEGASTLVKVGLSIFSHIDYALTWNVTKETPKMFYLEAVDSYGVRHVDQTRKSDIGVNKFGSVYVLPDDVKEVVKRYHTLMVEHYTDKLKDIESYLKFHQSQLEGEVKHDMA